MALKSNYTNTSRLKKGGKGVLLPPPPLHYEYRLSISIYVIEQYVLCFIWFSLDTVDLPNLLGKGQLLGQMGSTVNRGRFNLDLTKI